MNHFEYPLKIQTYSSENQQWGITEFQSHEDFLKYMQSQFKESPDKYKYKDSKVFQIEGLKYARTSKLSRKSNFEGGYYTKYAKGTYPWKKYWRNEKDKVLNGVIIDDIYIPPFYYWYLNFCPIYVDVEKKKRLPSVWDGDIWYMQYVMLAILSGMHVVGVKGRQKGYEMPDYQEVITPNGLKKIGSLKVGDYVYSVDGKPTKITAIYPQGEKDVYEITLRDGRNVQCGLNHLWSIFDIKSKNQNTLKTILLKDILDKYEFTSKIGNKSYKSYRYLLPSTEPVKWENIENLPIDPYVLGVCIGDGSINKQIRISSGDDFIFDEVLKRLGEDYYLSKSDKTKNSKVKRCTIKYKNQFHTEGHISINPLVRSFKFLNLCKNSYDKFIPEIYLNNSTPDQRLELLRGLMDTDGYINKEGKDLHYTTVSKKLAEDVAYLCRSLGISTTISEKRPKVKSHSVYYRVRIHPENINPFYLPRKKERFKNKRNVSKTAITGIRKIGKSLSTCITVENPSQLYLCKDFIVTHNSYKHMAILYWSYCWFESSVNTVGAFDEKLVKKSWRFLESYRKHINTYTAWKRGPVLPKSLEWNEITYGQDNNPYGLQSILKGVTFKQSPFNDVGGTQTFFNYEEPGVSPTLLETLEAIRPALEKGSVNVGTFIACGSVGELDDAEGLKQIVYNPEDYGFLSVKNIWDKNITALNEKCGIFISEAYNMIGVDKEGYVEKGRPFMDEHGHSDVEFSMKWIEVQEKKIKNSSKREELKQLQLSQKCTSLEQAFAQRIISEFPVTLLKKQQERIKLKEKTNSWEFKPQKGLMEEVNGKVVLNTKDPPKEHEYPIDPNWEDKRGVWTLYEPPDENAEFYTYFASVDAIEVDETTTSTSIATVDIFKTAIHVIYEIDKSTGREKTRIEGDKLVATYRGRFRTAKETNEQMWLGIKLYNAFTYPERNKPNFINYMRSMGRAEKYLAKEQDVPIFKDLNIKSGNNINNSKFGFYKGDSSEIWKYFKSYTKEYFQTEYSRNTFEKNDKEEILKIFTGIDRIDDYWLLEEFIKYREVGGKIKGNYDRLVSFMGALFICKIYQQNRFIKRRNDLPENVAEETPTRSKSINMLTGYSNKNKKKSIL